MIRTLFLVLCLILGFWPQARGTSIEIYAHGHKYDSLQAYLVSKKAAAVSSRPQKYSGSTEFTLSKAEGLTTGERTLHQLYVLGVENGMVGALRDFYETRGPSAFQMTQRIYPEQLPEVIAQAVAASENPKFLISRPGKVRIMALTAQDRSSE